MVWLLRGLLGFGVLLLLWGFAHWATAPRDCSGRLEAAVEDAWVAAWDEVSLSLGSGASVPSVRALRSSERGLRLAHRLESVVRDALGDADFVEPSSSLTRGALEDFLAIYDEARAMGAVDRPRAFLHLQPLEESEDRVVLILSAIGTTASLEVWVEADCIDGHLERVRVTRPGP
jgi:hypothetical protein